MNKLMKNKCELIMKSHVKEKREELNLERKVLADMIGETERTIQAVEEEEYRSDDFIPSVWLSSLIAIALNSKVEDLFEFELRIN